jgi:hypothetical protein
MKTSLECIPCFVRQSLDVVKMITDNAAEHERLMRDCLKWISEINIGLTPPAVAQILHRKMREVTEVKDPYKAAKDAHNNLASELVAPLKSRLRSSNEPFFMALRYAIMGNVIDLGAKNGISREDIYAEMKNADKQPLFGDLNAFKNMAAEAKKILYLADNTGEIFFDRLFIEQLPASRVTLAVRGAPVINDATREDAELAGIGEIAEIIDNGSDAPGTILQDCSPEFQRRFEDADMIISKGQGNYETLSDVEKNIFFILKIKCPIISAHAGLPVGTYVASRLKPNK